MVCTCIPQSPVNQNMGSVSVASSPAKQDGCGAILLILEQVVYSKLHMSVTLSPQNFNYCRPSVSAGDWFRNSHRYENLWMLMFLHKMV